MQNRVLHEQALTVNALVIVLVASIPLSQSGLQYGVVHYFEYPLICC